MGTGDDNTAAKLVFDNKPVERYELYEEIESVILDALDPYYNRVALVSILGILKLVEQKLMDAS